MLTDMNPSVTNHPSARRIEGGRSRRRLNTRNLALCAPLAFGLPIAAAAVMPQTAEAMSLKWDWVSCAGPGSRVGTGARGWNAYSAKVQVSATVLCSHGHSYNRGWVSGDSTVHHSSIQRTGVSLGYVGLEIFHTGSKLSYGFGCFLAGRNQYDHEMLCVGSTNP